MTTHVSQSDSLDGPDGRDRSISRDAAVMALVPHYRHERWLADCLASLVAQTRPLQAIVVIDDGSETPPVEIVERFPSVTLLASAENAGPYRLIQQVIEETSADAYLFQDADDWSAPDRLDALLDAAAEHDAELVGCQGVHIYPEELEAIPFSYPLDVNLVQARYPTGAYLLHPTSIVSRDLVMRLGGFATGLRAGADVEFLRRAVLAGRVVNSSRYGYFVRHHAAEAQAGKRRALHEELWRRAQENARRVAAERTPNLKPFRVAPPVALRHLLGPRV